MYRVLIHCFTNFSIEKRMPFAKKKENNTVAENVMLWKDFPSNHSVFSQQEKKSWTKEKKIFLYIILWKVYYSFDSTIKTSVRSTTEVFLIFSLPLHWIEIFWVDSKYAYLRISSHGACWFYEPFGLFRK